MIMRHGMVRWSVCFGASLVVGAVVYAGGSVAQAALEDSSWSGAVHVPGGIELGLIVHLTHEGGEGGAWTGTLDIPMQGVEGAELGALEVNGNAVSFELRLPSLPESAIPSFRLEIAADGKTASGTMMQSGVEMPVDLEMKTVEAIAAESADLRPQTPVGPFPYSEREVTIPVAAGSTPAHTLAGTLTIPEAAVFGDGPFGLAVLITGSGPQDRDETLFEHKPFAVIADALTRAGVAVLRFDDRGVGGSTGDFSTATTFDFADDVRAAVGFGAAQPEIDAGRVGLIGHSEGGLIGPMVAAGNDAVGFVVLLAGPGISGRDVLIGQAAKMMRVGGATPEQVAQNTELQIAVLDAIESGASEATKFAAMKGLVEHQMGVQGTPIPTGWDFRAILDQQLAGFDTPWMRTFIGLDPAVSLGKLEQPVLVMSGEKDLQVIADDNLPGIERALARAGNKDVTVRRLPGLNHLFQRCQTGAVSEYATIRETFDPDALEILTRWVVEHGSR